MILLNILFFILAIIQGILNALGFLSFMIALFALGYFALYCLQNMDVEVAEQKV
jgi:hypothetical protein